jgi:signal transduction histidine kinase/ligand-binding sensor domain-containing protein
MVQGITTINCRLLFTISVGLFVSLPTVQTLSQDWAYINYNDQNILPSSEVYQMHQDKSGFIWIATDNGVVRFDGADFITFNKSNGLADAVVFGIHEDVTGNLYFRGFTGAISTYQRGEMKAYPYNSKIKKIIGSSLISSLIADSLGILHLATSSSIGRTIDLDNKGNLTNFSQPPLTLFVKQINKQLLVGRGGVLGSIENVTIDNQKFKIPRHDSLENSAVLCYARWRKDIYLSKDHYLYRYDGRSVTLVRRFENSIVSISRDRDDHLWIGQMNGGVDRFSDTTFQSGFKISLFQKQSVTTVLEDNEGGFWFSTLEHGVFYTPNFMVSNYAYPPYSKVNAVIAGEDFVFLGFNSGKLTAINVTTRKEAWSCDMKYPIMSLFYDQYKKELWVSSNSKTGVFSNRGKLLREAVEVKSVKKFFRFPGNEIGAVNATGIYGASQTGNLKMVRSVDFWLRNILVKENEVYLAGISGLYKTDLSFSKIAPLKEFANLKVSGIDLLPTNDVLISTIGKGIMVISEKGELLAPRPNDFLFENVYQVWIDSSVWVATEKGLLRTETKSIARNGDSAYDFIDRGVGLLSNKVNFICRFKEETWCFLSDGYSILDNNEMRFANKHPGAYVKNIYINHEQAKELPFYDLPYDKNNISISLGFISFNNRNIIVRHKTNRSNRIWNYSRSATLDYFSLEPGSYIFDIQFSSDYTSWNKVKFLQTFQIHPAWWESYYFRIVIVLMMGLASYSFFRVRYKRKLLELEMQNRIRSEKERIARDLHDSLGGQLSSISIGLNRLAKEESDGDVQPIQDMADHAITELRNSLWVMDKEYISISELEQRINGLFWQYRKTEVPIDLQLNVDSILNNVRMPSSKAGHLFRIIQEAAQNTRKHSGATQFRISFEKLSHHIQLTISDNGIGFDKSRQQEGEHYGMNNMSHRAAQINASLTVESEPGNGVRIVVQVPNEI